MNQSIIDALLIFLTEIVLLTAFLATVKSVTDLKRKRLDNDVVKTSFIPTSVIDDAFEEDELEYKLPEKTRSLLEKAQEYTPAKAYPSEGEPYEGVHEYPLKRKSQRQGAWTDEDMRFLRENYTKLSIKEIAERMGRSPGAVQQQASISKIKKYRPHASREVGISNLGGILNNGWTTDEISYLRENHATKTAREMALELGRSTKAVENQIIRSGISDPGRRGRKWTPDEVAWLKQNYQTIPFGSMLAHYKADKGSLYTFLRRNGFRLKNGMAFPNTY
jgi:hypothetical protein